MAERKKAAVFLDRDGVLNRCQVIGGKPYAPRSLAGFRLLPGARLAVDRLKAAGFVVVVVTNQPDIGNRLVSPKVVDAMHEKVRSRLAVDDIRLCPHRQNEGCQCRKPKPGMLIAAAQAWRIALGRSFMVGDRDGDIVAGHRAGCRTILVDRHYGEGLRAVPDARVTCVAKAADVVLQWSRSSENWPSDGREASASERN